jgi:hypothetical protein
MLSKFEGNLKNFTTFTFGLQSLFSILEICCVYIFRQAAFGTDYRCLIAIANKNRLHEPILFFTCFKLDLSSFLNHNLFARVSDKASLCGIYYKSSISVDFDTRKKFLKI